MIRTQPVSAWRDMRRPLLAATVFSIGLPFVLGMMAAGIAVFIRDVDGTTGPAAVLAGLSVTLYYSPVLALPAALSSLPVTVLALRRGYAGWGTALVYGAFLGTVTTLMFGTISLPAWGVGVVSGAIWCMLYWTGARLFAPWAVRHRD